jgi:hypothetical protein
MTYSHLLSSNDLSGLAVERSAVSPQVAEERAEAFEQVMNQDRNFFLQHPDQDYYIRPITPVEVAEGQAIGKEVTERSIVLVGEVVPGSRVRLTVGEGEPLPIEEFKTIQYQMRRELGAKPPSITDRLKLKGKARSKAKGFGAGHS